jgi:hypothetical protein
MPKKATIEKRQWEAFQKAWKNYQLLTLRQKQSFVHAANISIQFEFEREKRRIANG